MEYRYPRLRGRIREILVTQGRLAERLGISQTSLTNKLTGRTEFNRDEIIRIVDLLNIPKSEVYDYFFAGQIEKSQGKGGPKCPSRSIGTL